MEYLEGETLATRLLKGPLPLDQVLQYAIEIADALDKAHRKGVTHRDIKPGNIMLTKTGTKLLDFGLAKLKQEAAPAAAMSVFAASDTEPEPDRRGHDPGHAAVHGAGAGRRQRRLDRCAHGHLCVWRGRVRNGHGQEGVRGQESGQRDGQRSCILDPPPISSLQPMTPPALDRVVKRCLAKEPDDRWQTASDLMHELKWIAEGGSQAVASAPSAAAQRQRSSGWIAAAVLLLALAALAFVHFREAPPAAPPEMRTEIVTPSTTDPVSFALSPDGRQMVFVASGDGIAQLWLRRLDRTEAQPLAGTEGASYPFWSPDSRSVGFFARGKLKRTNIGGGPPQTLADASNNRGGTWGPDGCHLVCAGRQYFDVPHSSIGRRAGSRDQTGEAGWPSVSSVPAGRPAFPVLRCGGDQRRIYVGSLDSAETKRLAAADTAGVYAPNGWLLFVRAGTLLAQRLDLERGELTGDPVTVADPVTFDATTSAGALSVSAAGLVAYRSGEASQRQLVWFDRSGKTLGTLGRTGCKSSFYAESFARWPPRSGAACGAD